MKIDFVVENYCLRDFDFDLIVIEYIASYVRKQKITFPAQIVLVHKPMSTLVSDQSILLQAPSLQLETMGTSCLTQASIRRIRIRCKLNRIIMNNHE